MKEIILKIQPMSTNQCWQGRKFMTPKYKAWRKEMGWLLFNKELVINQDKYEIEIEVWSPNANRSDADNYIKPILDSLVENQIITDDRKIDTLHIKKHKGANRILIRIL